jgi:hypothetical protein
MDDRDRAKSKVIPFRRKKRSENGDREHVASKIFAEEDGIGTFSLGNLVPPKGHGSADDARGILPDGFEREQEPGSPTPARGVHVDQDRDEFFEELLARTSVGGPTDGAQPQAPTLPGSAYLPNELPATDGARRVSLGRLVDGLAIRRGHAAGTTLADTTGRTRSRMTRAAAVGAVAIVMFASVTGAILLSHGEHARPSARLPHASDSASSIEPRPASAAAWAALREHTKAPGRRHHRAGSRHRTTTRSHKSRLPAAQTVSCCASQTAQVQPPPSESSPSTSGGSGGTPSASTSGGSGSTRHRAKAGPTGRVSLIGAGTTPSG